VASYWGVVGIEVGRVRGLMSKQQGCGGVASHKHGVSGHSGKPRKLRMVEVPL
jgi:hypothetical protein